MKLKLSKKKVKNLSFNEKSIAKAQTPQINGGTNGGTILTFFDPNDPNQVGAVCIPQLLPSKYGC